MVVIMAATMGIVVVDIELLDVAAATALVALAATASSDELAGVTLVRIVVVDVEGEDGAATATWEVATVPVAGAADDDAGTGTTTAADDDAGIGTGTTAT